MINRFFPVPPHFEILGKRDVELPFEFVPLPGNRFEHVGSVTQALSRDAIGRGDLVSEDKKGPALGFNLIHSITSVFLSPGKLPSCVIVTSTNGPEDFRHGSWSKVVIVMNFGLSS